jgi:8-oxo-dGTP pyrophosphatase MutT (NUDIX family)
MKKNPYKILSSRTVYKNPWIEVKEEEVISPSNEKKVFGIVDNGQGVQIVAVNDKNEVYLIREYYYVLGEYGIQTPAGGIEKGETPLAAAKKELEEETGITASTWIPLGQLHPLTMIIKSPQHLFLALDLRKGKKTEKEIEVVKVPLHKVYDMVLSGEISFAPSSVAILKAKAYLEKNKI